MGFFVKARQGQGFLEEGTMGFAKVIDVHVAFREHGVGGVKE